MCVVAHCKKELLLGWRVSGRALVGLRSKQIYQERNFPEATLQVQV